MTTRTRITLIALATGFAMVVAGAVFFYKMIAAPMVDRFGGTILVYEVDPEISPPGTYEPHELAAALRRRIDPMGCAASVRMVSPTRVQIDIPRILKQVGPPGSPHLDDHAKVVEEIKETVTRIGSLEFRIVANHADDGEAIAAAQQFFASARNEGVEKEELDRASRQHAPPPPVAGGKAFPVRIAGTTSRHSYSWVELGRLERRTLGLSMDQSGGPRWREAERARDRGEPYIVFGMQALLYSRKLLNPETLRPENRYKGFEYFLLTRDSEPDSMVTGGYLSHIHPMESSEGLPMVGFHFNAEGGRRFGDLTRRNRPTDETHRYLAIIFDGLIESAPTLNTVITTDGVIEGDFTIEEVDRYVRLLSAGHMPATLKPVPVSEVEVKGKGGFLPK